MIELFMKPEVLDQGLAAHARRSAITPDLEHIIDSTYIGEALFAGIQTVTTAFDFGREVEEVLDEELKVKVLGKDEQRKIHDRLSKVAASYADSGYMELRREFEVCYGKFKVKLYATDPMQEALMRLAARVKCRSLGSDDLKFLPFEADFMEPQPAGLTHPSLLSSMKKARDVLTDIMQHDKATSLTHIQEAVRRAEGAIIGLDSSCSIEIEFNCGGMASSFSQALEDAVLATLPGYGQESSLRECLDEIRALAKGSMARLASRDCQAKLDSCIDILDGMQLNRPPPSHMAGSTGFWREVYKKLGHFCRVEEKITNPHGVEVSEWKCGLDAVKLMLARLGDRVKKGPSDVPLHEVEAMTTWSFMMTEAEKSQVGEWLKQICSQKSGKRKGAPSARVSKEKKEKKEKKGPNVDEFFAD